MYTLPTAAPSRGSAAAARSRRLRLCSSSGSDSGGDSGSSSGGSGGGSGGSAVVEVEVKEMGEEMEVKEEEEVKGGEKAIANAAKLESTREMLRERGLKLPSYAAADLRAGLAKLKAVEGVADGHADDNTLVWFLKDCALDVTEAAEKVAKYNAWRVENDYLDVTFASVEAEYGTGKALLLDAQDLLGRQVVSVTLTKHVIGEYPLSDTKCLTVHLLDEGLERIHAANAGAAESEPEMPETVLAMFDLRGFGMANADIDFLKFFIRCIFSYFPKRVSQVLLVDAPFVFRPVWVVVKPMLGKYSGLVRFVSLAEAKEYFAAEDTARVFGSGTKDDDDEY